MAKRKWANKNPKRRLSIDFLNESDMIKFYETVVKPHFDALATPVSIFSRDKLDDRHITNSQEFIIKSKSDRPYGEMIISKTSQLTPKES